MSTSIRIFLYNIDDPFDDLGPTSVCSTVGIPIITEEGRGPTWENNCNDFRTGIYFSYYNIMCCVAWPILQMIII